MCLYARAGVLYEGENEVGVSHFVEHLAFRSINAVFGGTLYETLDRNGLTFTAATYKELIQFSITGRRSDFACAADILTKLFEPFRPSMLKGDFAAERGRIRAEIREYGEKSSLDYLVKGSVWQHTPAGRMITGTLSDVSALSLAACERARQRILAKDNFFFYLTGNFPADAVGTLAACADRYAPSLCRFPPRENVCPLPPDYRRRRAGVLLKNADYYMVELSFDLDPSRPFAGKAARNLFYDMLFAGENCLFFRELSEKHGFIYSYDAKLEEYRNAANLCVSYEVSGKNLYDSISAAVDVFERLKTDASGLATAKVFYTDSAALALDNAEELGWTMAYESHILGERFESVKERADNYRRVTQEDIMKLAADTFRRTALVAGVKGKKKSIDAERIEAILARLGQ